MILAAEANSTVNVEFPQPPGRAPHVRNAIESCPHYVHCRTAAIIYSWTRRVQERESYFPGRFVA